MGLRPIADSLHTVILAILAMGIGSEFWLLRDINPGLHRRVLTAVISILAVSDSLVFNRRTPSPVFMVQVAFKAARAASLAVVAERVIVAVAGPEASTVVAALVVEDTAAAVAIVRNP
jgi:hypothetical protein